MADGLTTTEVSALRAGYRRLRELSGLLDAINVFPVADADTGRNLVASFAPLERDAPSAAALAQALLWSALGNSGNIGVGFLGGVLEQPARPLVERFARGEALARAAVADPRPGTMLTVLERLRQASERHGTEPAGFVPVAAALGDAVAETTARLPLLAECGVVDSGALGLFAFLEEYLGTLVGSPERTDIAARFRGRLALRVPRGVADDAGRLRAGAAGDAAHGTCVDAMVEVSSVEPAVLEAVRALGDSAVLVVAGNLLKVHLHAADPEHLRHALAAHGRLLRFETSSLAPPGAAASAANPAFSGRARLVTDAAGSLSLAAAAALDVELLASHVSLPDGSGPETVVDRAEVFAALRAGQRISTAQAPLAQRHQRFTELLERHHRVVYLCVGSAFTGNYAAATEWARQQGVSDRFLVIDSGVASGRLAVVAWRLAQLARAGALQDWSSTAARLLAQSDELIFVERLEYLARGGRLGRGSAWFGDLLGLRPVVTPTPQGAKRVAMAKSFAGQLELVQRRLRALPDRDRALILLQHTDNEALVRDRVLPVVREVASAAEIEVGPLSLTTAVHTGPGTWAVALLPSLPDLEAPPCE